MKYSEYKMKKILGIYGAGGVGREILELAKKINSVRSLWDNIIFIDDIKTDIDNIHGTKLYSFEKVNSLFKKDEIEIVISLGEPELRRKLYEKVSKEGYFFATLIHPTVTIPDTTKVGNGVIISYNAFISCDTIIGNNVLIQPLSGIGHDCKIGDHSVISGHSDLGGGTVIGDGTYIALNVCVRDHTSIGNNVIVSAGSAVLRDVQNDVVVQGNPARVILKNTERKVFK